MLGSPLPDSTEMLSRFELLSCLLALVCAGEASDKLGLVEAMLALADRPAQLIAQAATVPRQPLSGLLQVLRRDQRVWTELTSMIGVRASCASSSSLLAATGGAVVLGRLAGLAGRLPLGLLLLPPTPPAEGEPAALRLRSASAEGWRIGTSIWKSFVRDAERGEGEGWEGGNREGGKLARKARQVGRAPTAGGEAGRRGAGHGRAGRSSILVAFALVELAHKFNTSTRAAHDDLQASVSENVAARAVPHAGLVDSRLGAQQPSSGVRAAAAQVGVAGSSPGQDSEALVDACFLRRDGRRWDPGRSRRPDDEVCRARPGGLKRASGVIEPVALAAASSLAAGRVVALLARGRKGNLEADRAAVRPTDPHRPTLSPSYLPLAAMASRFGA